MIELNIPGMGVTQLEHLVSDVNGTLALDGKLVDGVGRLLLSLADRLQIHLLTADTHGQQDVIDQQLGLTAVRIPAGDEMDSKAVYVQKLGPEKTVAIGQGINDAGMLQEAKIGIGILSKEGLAKETLIAADLLVPDIQSALELLEKPLRLVASLRR
jgi:P-type E1-E2 ATPase